MNNSDLSAAEQDLQVFESDIATLQAWAAAHSPEPCWSATWRLWSAALDDWAAGSQQASTAVEVALRGGSLDAQGAVAVLSRGTSEINAASASLEASKSACEAAGESFTAPSSFPASPVSSYSAPETAVIPVVACESSYGYPAASTTALPPSATMSALSASDAASLALYAATNGSAEQLAPRGWSCTFSAGADGSWGMAMIDPNDPSGEVLYEGAYNVPGTVLAAPFFPALCPAEQQTMPGPCPTPAPGEVIVPDSSTLVHFSAPPGVLVSGMAYWDLGISSTRYQTVGAMSLFGLQGSEPEPAKAVVCLLPASRASLCQRLVDASVAYWQAER